MQNILILADGIVAKHFLERVIENIASKNNYFVVYTDVEVLPDKKTENIKYYRFDPTSFVKISYLFNDNFSQVLIILKNRIDTVASYENIRRVDKNINIVILDRWNLRLDDQNTILLNSNEILANRLIDYLPNVPKIAQNIGLGLGEIMEVLVPFGSSYAYRHIGVIEQKNWKIVAVYRKNRLVLPTPKLMIWPNDLLVVVGDPKVLKNIYRSIKSEIGQFPIPYGQNSYLFIDMSRLNGFEIEKSLEATLSLHKRLKDKKLIIRVINPSNIKILRKIKDLDGKNIEVKIDYLENSYKNMILKDLKLWQIGLLLLYNKEFENIELKKFLYELKIPIFSISNESINSIKSSAILLTKDIDLEHISSSIFDISIQLNLDLILYDIDPDSNDKKDIIEHFENLASIFSKKIRVVKSKNNPIRELREKENILLFYPFNKKILKNRVFRFLSTDSEVLYFKLNKFNQVFIPVD